MDSEGVLMPLIHEHLMMPWNDLRRGRCCGRFEAISNGYYCKTCDFFVHKKCGDEASKYIEHPSHPNHTLQLLSNASRRRRCNLCGRHINYLSYSCEICKFNMDIHCAMYPPPELIENSERHHHKLTLLKELIAFMCDDVKCGKLTGSDFAYVCHECDLTFHVDCIWHPSKVYHESADIVGTGVKLL